MPYKTKVTVLTAAAPWGDPLAKTDHYVAPLARAAASARDRNHAHPPTVEWLVSTSPGAAGQLFVTYVCVITEMVDEPDKPVALTPIQRSVAHFQERKERAARQARERRVKKVAA